ncbi:gluzincin family metallopeptidase [Chromobacterium phragmitis]
MRLPLIAACLCGPLSHPALAAYTVSLEDSPHPAPRFSLDLPDRHGEFLEAPAGAQIANVRCGHSLLPKQPDGRWRLSQACRQVRWEATLNTPPPEGPDASAQQSLALPGWAVLTSSTVLLRESGKPEGSILAIRVAGKPDTQAYVPATGEAPEFYAIGKGQETIRQVAGWQVRYVADDLKRVAARGLLDHHAEALTALRRVFPPPRPNAPFSGQLLVTLLGRDGASSANGAGGMRSLLVNYPRDTAERDTFLLAILAHEQSHQLLALAGVSMGSAWMSEGLAHYYGLKTMRQSRQPQAEKDKVWQLFVKPERAPAQGLARLERRHREGDKSAYPLFYSQGATFFALLDQALQDASQGRRSLDDFIAQLRAEPDGSLPDSLRAELRAAGGARVDALLARYVDA